MVPKLTIYKHEREEVEASAILDVFYQIYGSRNSLGDFILEYEEAFFEITGEVVEEPEGVTLTGQGSIKPMNTPKMQYEPPHRYTTFKIDPNIGQMRIKITCKKTFDDLRGKQIRAYTLTEGEKADSPIKKCAGVLQVMPNSQHDRKVLKLLLVNVMTNTDGGDKTQYGYDATKLCEEKENLRMFLRQALIDPIFKEEKLNLSGKGKKANTQARDEFNRLYALPDDFLFAYDDSGRTGKENIAIYLHKKLQALNRQALEGGYLPVFFVPQAKLKSISSDGTEDSPAGYCMVDKQLIIMSKGTILGSLAHEVFHSLKLPHTWAHKDHIQANIKDLTAPNGKYSFEFMKTYNIMDYNRLKYHIYYWQAIIANKNALAEPNDYKPEQL